MSCCCSVILLPFCFNESSERLYYAMRLSNSRVDFKLYIWLLLLRTEEYLHHVALLHFTVSLCNNPPGFPPSLHGSSQHCPGFILGSAALTIWRLTSALAATGIYSEILLVISSPDNNFSLWCGYCTTGRFAAPRLTLAHSQVSRRSRCSASYLNVRLLSHSSFHTFELILLRLIEGDC